MRPCDREEGHQRATSPGYPCAWTRRPYVWLQNERKQPGRPWVSGLRKPSVRKLSARRGTTMASLRQIAKQLGISAAYLSYMASGKRPWRLDLYGRYCQLVNTSVNTHAYGVNSAVVTADGDEFVNKNWSGRWDSNPRPSPWQGDALPLSHFRLSGLPRRPGAEGRNRTDDTWIFSPLLYP